MDPSFGARLRLQREHKHIALAAIAADTKIKLSLLEGLERDDLSYWPDGIFRRAYVRSYAKAIGLDPETVVREFLEIHPQPTDLTPALATSTVALQGEPVREPSLAAIAELCTRLGRVVDRREVVPLLSDAATMLDAAGLIVWCWDPREAALRPSLAHGYTETALACMSFVATDADNAVATAFRSATTCVVKGGVGMSGALVTPLMARSGCVGVFALELRNGGEARTTVRALAAILAAQLVTLLGPGLLADTATA
jgi:transcriptional regulator with XRE-family HTH domain